MLTQILVLESVFFPPTACQESMTPAGDVIYVIVQNCIIPQVEQNIRYKFKIKKKRVQI